MPVNVFAAPSAFPVSAPARAPFEIPGTTGFTRMTIRGRNHTLTLRVAGEAEDGEAAAPSDQS